MAEKEAAEAGKPGGDGPEAAQQQIAAEKDEGATTGAEDSIHSYVASTLQTFADQMDDVASALDGYLWQDAQTFNQAGFFNFIGGKLGDELTAVAGGPSPIMSAIVGEISNGMDFAARSTGDISLFLTQGFRSGTKYAAWYARDSIAGICDAQWGELLSLAANGGNQFVPAIHQLGLPTEIDVNKFASKLTAHADAYKMAMGMQQQSVKDDTASEVDSEKQAEIEEETKADMAEDDVSKEAAAG